MSQNITSDYVSDLKPFPTYKDRLFCALRCRLTEEAVAASLELGTRSNHAGCSVPSGGIFQCIWFHPCEICEGQQICLGTGSKEFSSHMQNVFVQFYNLQCESHFLFRMDGAASFLPQRFYTIKSGCNQISSYFIR